MKTPTWRSDKRTSSERGYNSKWRKARETYLWSNPLCVMCKEQGKVEVANVVNHIVPHKGDQALFWDKTIGKQFVSSIMIQRFKDRKS